MTQVSTKDGSVLEAPRLLLCVFIVGAVPEGTGQVYVNSVGIMGRLGLLFCENSTISWDTMANTVVLALKTCTNKRDIVIHTDSFVTFGA